MLSPKELDSLVHQLQASAKDLAEIERLRGLEVGECFKCGMACANCGGPSSPSKKKKSSKSNPSELREKDAEIVRLKAEMHGLEQERLGMLAMIERLRSQITTLQDKARGAGHGDLVDKMMDESLLSATLRSPEMSIFTRLYQDAVRRMHEMKSLIAQKFAATNQSADEIAEQFPEVLQHVPPGKHLEPLQPSPAASTRSLDFVVRLKGGGQDGGPADGSHARLPALLQPGMEYGAAGAGRGGGSGFSGGFFHSTGGFFHTSGGVGSVGGRMPRYGAANARGRGGAPLAGGSASPLGQRESASSLKRDAFPFAGGSEPASPLRRHRETTERKEPASPLRQAMVHSGAGHRVQFGAHAEDLFRRTA